MIRVTVELISAIDPSRSRVLGRAEIANEGPAGPGSAPDPRFCQYHVRLSKWAPKDDQTWKQTSLVLTGTETVEAIVERFDREQRGPWDLIYLALKACVGRRNP